MTAYVFVGPTLRPEDLAAAGDITPLPPVAQGDVYRIAQESLTNVARHSEARHVTMALERGRDSVVLRVVDDGRGFDGAPVEQGGLRSMRERALLIGGALAIKEGVAGGVDVRLEVPSVRVARAVAVE